MRWTTSRSAMYLFLAGLPFEEPPVSLSSLFSEYHVPRESKSGAFLFSLVCRSLFICVVVFVVVIGGGAGGSVSVVKYIVEFVVVVVVVIVTVFAAIVVTIISS